MNLISLKHNCYNILCQMYKVTYHYLALKNYTRDAYISSVIDHIQRYAMLFIKNNDPDVLPVRLRNAMFLRKCRLTFNTTPDSRRDRIPTIECSTLQFLRKHPCEMIESLT